MSETANKLFNGLRAIREAAHSAAPGLANFGPELKAELSRLATQGSMELASALLGNGSAFVPYGPGQYTPDVDQSLGHVARGHHGDQLTSSKLTSLGHTDEPVGAQEREGLDR
jgi:hypothetical protein